VTICPRPAVGIRRLIRGRARFLTNALLLVLLAAALLAAQVAVEVLGHPPHRYSM
jgi:hypothetical protein